MTFKNALKFGIIMSLVMCTAFYIIPPPEHILGKIVYSFINYYLHRFITSLFYIRQRKHEKKIRL